MDGTIRIARDDHFMSADGETARGEYDRAGARVPRATGDEEQRAHQAGVDARSGGGERNCSECKRWYMPRRPSSSSWVPRSTMRPSSITRIKFECATVDSRCAMTNTVRP